MTDHMQEAIETAAEELHPGLFSLSDHRYSIRFDNPEDYRAEHQADVLVDVGIAMYAALPHLRAMIAKEILDAETQHNALPEAIGEDPYDRYAAALRDAAQIAEGQQK